MIKRLIIFVLTIFGYYLPGQLVVNNTMTPAQLVQNVLVGSGITVSNVTFSGSPLQIGYFDGTNSNLGMGEGLLITTGDINNAIGPNNNGGASTSLFTAGDADVEQLAGLTTNDAAILEFDFIPTANVVNFEYIFASEEYMEFANSGFNDAFGFFISGPGIAGPFSGGSENIALIPGTNTYVTIDNVNANFNPTYYQDNGDGFTAPFNTDQQYVQYDGLTTILTATSVVTACETYHIRIVIADGMDSAFDSGVFLKAGSLNGGNVTIQASTPTADSIAVEGCATGEVSLNIPTALPTDLVINYVIGGTATNGVDYQTIQSSATIAAGETSVNFTINPIIDGVAEGTETIVLTIQTSSCSEDSVVLFINDLAPIVVDAGPDQSICGGDNANLTAAATGGGGGYTYSWDNGAGNGDAVSVSPNQTTTYTVTVTDGCGSVAVTDQVTVTAGQLANVNAGVDDNYCTGNNIQIGDVAQVGYTYSWSPVNGLSDPTISNPTVNLTNGTTQPITQEYILSSSDGLCDGTDTIIVTINPIPSASFTIPANACASDTIDVTFTGTASQQANYTWDFDIATVVSGNDAGPYQITFPSDGTFNFTLDVDDSGCNSIQATESIDILNTPAAIAGADESICNGDALQIGGNTEVGVTYLWSPTTGLNDPNISNPNITTVNNGATPVSQTYTLTSDNGTCSNSDQITVTINPVPVSNITVSPQACEGQTVDVTFNGTASQNANFTWNFNSGWVYSGGDQGPYEIIFDNEGSYDITLDIEDFGCISNQSLGTVIVTAFPTSNAGSDVSYCAGETANIGMLAENNVVYSWDPVLDLSNGAISDPTVSLDNTGTTSLTQTYTLSATENGCTSTDDVLVTVYPIPAPASVSPNAQCLDGNSFAFSAGGDFINNGTTSFIWNFGNSASPGSSSDQDPSGISYNSSGTYVYTLEITSNGCVGPLYTDSIVVEPMPQVDFDDTFFGACVPFVYQATNLSNVDANATYLWDIGGFEFTDENPIVLVILPGLQDISLTVTSGAGCESNSVSTGVIEGYPIPQASFVLQDTLSELHPTSGINSTASNSDSCFYVITHIASNFVDTVFACNTNYTFLDTGMYVVDQIVFSEFGCSDTISDTTRIFPELTVYIPNAFIPDSNGSNDYWGAYGTGFLEFELYVYDRWGNLIFSSKDINDHWNGKYQNNGQDAPIGVYVYKVRLVDAQSIESFRHGIITLLR